MEAGFESPLLRLNSKDGGRSVHLNQSDIGGPDLDDEEREVVNYVIAKRPAVVSKTVFDSELLVHTDKTSINRVKMLSLLPGSWVSGEPLLASGRNANYILEAQLSKWTDGRLEHCTRIYIPINDINEHWYLLVVDVAYRSVYVVDTLEYGYVERRLDVIYKMLTFIQELVDMKNEFKFWKGEKLIMWGLTFPDHVPNQEQLHDGSNCGMYVIHFMINPLQIPNVTPNTVITDKHRLFLIASLILWGKNKNKDKIKKLAQELVIE